MKPDVIHTGDTLKVRVTVRSLDADGAFGAAVDLTGATFAAAFGDPGSSGVAGTVTVVDGPNGVVDVAFPASQATPPSTVAHLRVTKGGETQTVWSETFIVKQSVTAS